MKLWRINMLCREVFKQCIEEIRTANKFNEDFNKMFSRCEADGWVFFPTCEVSTIKLLSMLCNDQCGDMISYFCYDLDFGSKWKKGMILDKDGQDIKLATVDDLYDYLCAR